MNLDHDKFCENLYTFTVRLFSEDKNAIHLERINILSLSMSDIHIYIEIE